MKILAIGHSALMDGFGLLGIETYPDEDPDVINQVLTELDKKHERALVFIQRELMQADIPMIKHLHSEGGSILLCEIPDLKQAENFQPAVEKLIGQVLGPSVLERTHGK